MKIVKTTVFIFLAFTLSGCFWKHREAVNDKFERSLYESLYIQHEYLGKSEALANSDLSVAITDDVIEDLAQTLTGIIVTPTDPPSGFNNLEIEIEKVSISPQDGSINLGLDLELRANSIEVSLKAEGALFFDNISSGAEDDEIEFVVGIQSIKSSFSWSLFRLSGVDLLDNFLTVSAIKELGDSLTLRLPVADVFNDPISVNGSEVTKDDDSGLEVTIEYSSPPFTPNVSVSMSAFVISDSGLMLFGDINQPSITAPVAPSIDQAQVSEEIKRLRELIADKMSAIPEPEHDIDLQLKNKFFAEAFGLFNSMPEPNRTVTIRSTKVVGKLYEDKWKDNILGDGGIFAELRGNNAVNGSATIHGVSHSLSSTGISYTTGARIRASAKAKTRFDPLIGGGIGQNWNLSGKADPTLSGHLDFYIDTHQGHSLLLMKNSTTCSVFDFEIKDSGALKLGIITKQLLGDDAPSLSAVLGDSPLYIDLAEASQSDDATLNFPSKFVEVKYVPVTASSSSEGVRIGLDVVIGLVDKSHDEAAAGARIEQRVNEVEASFAKSQCADKGSIKVLVAGQDFGENNEIVKVVSAMIDAYKKGAKEIEEEFDKRQKNLINPPRGSALHKPLHKPVETLKCIVTLFNDC